MTFDYHAIFLRICHICHVINSYSRQAILTAHVLYCKTNIIIYISIGYPNIDQGEMTKPRNRAKEMSTFV